MARLFDTVLVTGGAGYCGSLLVPQLLDEGYKVTVYDTMFFGDHFLPMDNPNLKVVQGDIRDTELLAKSVAGHDAFVSLACISNDASFELDEKLSTSVNLDAFEPMVVAAKKAGVKRFVYASSSSVYGVSDKPNVTEDHPLVPLTLYNKYKGMCEPLLRKHTDDNFVGVTFRPATVCGYAPRLRLDLSVNILTIHALVNHKIRIFGGKQLRPNLNIKDMVRAYLTFLAAPSAKVDREAFNVGFQNLAIEKIAFLVRDTIGDQTIELEYTPSDDNRSYHVNSDKVKRVLGFEVQYGIEDAIQSIVDAYRAGKIPDPFKNTLYSNIKRMQELRIS